MIAYEIKAGQRFTIKGRAAVLLCVDDSRPPDWLKYPGIVYRDVESGKYGGLGGGNNVLLCEAQPIEKIYTCPTCGARHEDGGRGKPPVYCDECGADWKDGTP